MHADAQSGEAAHAAYKGGLAAGQARRLQTFLESVAKPAQQLPARLWDSSEAAARELFRCSQGFCDLLVVLRVSC